MIDWQQFKTKQEAFKYLRTTKDKLIKTNADAEKYMRMYIPKESHYQQAVMKRIKELVPSADVWKEAAGPYSQIGRPDVSAVINGRFYAFEIKRPLLGKPTKTQEQTIQKIKKAGGRAYIITWPDEVTRILIAHKEV